MRATRSLFSLTVIVAIVTVAACGSDSKRTTPSSGSTATGTITVSTAASLTEAFTEIGAGFDAAHPGSAVKFNFGSSATLATQIQQGAPADSFASADQATMDEV